MKHKKQFKRAMSIKAHFRGGCFYLHLAIPTRWLFVFAIVAGALLTSMPAAQIVELLLQLIQ